MRPLYLALLLVMLAGPGRAFPGEGDVMFSEGLSAQIFGADPEAPVLQSLVPPGLFAYQGLVQDTDGSILATQGDFAFLTRIDTSDGAIRVVADAASGGLPFLAFPIDVELDAAGRIILLDAGPNPGPQMAAMGSVVGVDDDGEPTGTSPKTLISDGGDLLDVQQLAVHPNGMLYVASLNAFFDGQDPETAVGGIIEVDPSIDVNQPGVDPFANQRVVSRGAPDWQSSPAAIPPSPSGIAALGSDLVVATIAKGDGSGGVAREARIVRIDPSSGDLLEEISTGGRLCEPVQVAVLPDGRVAVTDFGTQALLVVDPADGSQQVLVQTELPGATADDPTVPLDCAPGEDPPVLSFQPIGIAVATVTVPEPGTGASGLVAILTACALLRRSRS